MIKLTSLCVFTCLFILSSCKGDNKTSEVNNNIQFEDPTELMDFFLTSLKEKDISKIENLFSPDGSASILLSNNEMIESNKLVIEHYQNWAKNVNSTLELKIIASNINPSLSNFKIDVTYRANKTPDDKSFNRRDFTVILEKVKAHWYIAHSFGQVPE